jgi:protocatechuate 3,4-dioxygenase beta subunit
VRPRGRVAVVAAVVAVAVAVGGLLLLGSRDPGPDRDARPAAAAPACAPTRGEPAQGTGEVAAGATSSARLGPGGELRRTPETLAAGRGGRRLIVSGTVYAADCVTPLAGATLEVWQTTAAGEYGPRQAGGEERCCYLAAALRTDAAGRYRFETVRPGHYKGESQPPPAHIHFEVRHPDAAGLLTELLFEGDPHLGPDPPGEVVAPTSVAGADPPELQARFDIVLRPR